MKTKYLLIMYIYSIRNKTNQINSRAISAKKKFFYNSCMFSWAELKTNTLYVHVIAFKAENFKFPYFKHT